MSAARVLIVALALTAAAAGVAMYWLQVYAFYDELPEATEIALPGGPLAVEGFRGIDKTSSPIGYRACFTVASPPDEAALVPYDHPTPLNPPGWFDCFDAPAIDAALASGEARAVLAQPDVPDGVDRVVALFPDGRGYAWTQIDLCGPLADEGDRPPECPPDQDATGAP